MNKGEEEAHFQLSKNQIDPFSLSQTRGGRIWYELMQKNGFNRLIYGVMIACKAELKEYDAAYIWVKQLQKMFFAAQDIKPRASCV